MKIKIIAGRYKGHRINTPDIARPTLSRHRQSLFDILESLVLDPKSESFFDNKVVLDCFSGSGALGIESLSRGAKHACFVDNNKNAISILRSNISKLNAENFSTIIFSDINKIKKCIEHEHDIVFLDPPYDNAKVLIMKTIKHLFKSNWISEKSILVVETPKASGLFIREADDFNILSTKTIGNSLFTIVKLSNFHPKTHFLL